jgi:hypothetical protein
MASDIGETAGPFDIITSIATFEHVLDFRGVVAACLRQLAPSGVLLFEVPLISATRDDKHWYHGSYEHIFYLTISGLDRLRQELYQRQQAVAAESVTFAELWAQCGAAQRAKHEELMTAKRSLAASEAELAVRQRPVNIAQRCTGRCCGCGVPLSVRWAGAIKLMSDPERLTRRCRKRPRRFRKSIGGVGHNGLRRLPPQDHTP